MLTGSAPTSDIGWKPFPAFPPSVRLAVVVGQPSEPGPYTIRVKVPSGVKLMPHRHPEDRVYTVMSGVFYIGLGDQFDGDKVEAYPSGRGSNLPHYESWIPMRITYSSRSPPVSHSLQQVSALPDPHLDADDECSTREKEMKQMHQTRKGIQHG